MKRTHFSALVAQVLGGFLSTLTPRWVIKTDVELSSVFLRNAFTQTGQNGPSAVGSVALKALRNVSDLFVCPGTESALIMAEIPRLNRSRPVTESV